MSRRLLIGVVIFVAAAIFIAVSARPAPHLVADVLDVGDGDAVLLRSGSVEVLVDAGPDRAVLGGLGECMPLFDRYIEAVILTHPHADHVAGLIHVLRRYRVGEVLVTEPGDGELWSAVEAALDKVGVPIRILRSGTTISLPRADLAVLWPPPGFRSSANDPNDYSAVIRAGPSGSKDSTWVMLTGDATPAVEAALLDSGLSGPTDVLKVAHHGSRFSTTAGFVGAVRPRLAVVSTGDRFANHPAWVVLERLRRAGAEIYRTDLDGHLRFSFSGSGPRAITGLLAVWPPILAR